MPNPFTAAAARKRRKELEQLESFRRLHQFASEVAQANLGCHLQELGLHMVAAQLYELLAAFQPRALKKKLSGDLGQYLHLVHTVARVSEGGLRFERYRAELAEKKARIQKELDEAKKTHGLSKETIERIERELNLF